MRLIKKKRRVLIKCRERETTSYHFKSAAGASLQSFLLHALFLLSAFSMTQRFLSVEGLKARHWLWLGGMLAALVVMFELLLPAVTRRLKPQWAVRNVCIGVSVAILYLAARAFYRFYLEHQLDLEDGLLALAERYVSAYNAYYGKSMQLPPGKEEFVLLSAVFCMMIAVIVQYLSVQMTGLRWLVLAFPSGVIVLEMWVGQTPDVSGMLLFSGACVYLAAGRTGNWKSRVTAVGLWLLLFAFTASAGSGLAEKMILKAPEYKAYQKKLETVAKNLATTNLWGIRETVTNDTPEFSDKEILTISAEEKPVGNLYLKSFVGTSYENGSWKEDTRTFSYARRSEGIDAEELNELLWNTTIREVEGNVWGFRETDYTIRYVYNPQSYALLPYFADLDGLGTVSCVGDQKLKVKRGTKELTVHGTAWNDSGHALSVMQCMYRTNDISDENWDWYGSYVKQQYLGTSGAVEAAERLTKELPGNYKEMSTFTVTNRNEWRVTVAEKVAEYLSEHYTYSWNLDTITDGTDPVEYFLTTGKKGYCMHFAAAGTLMLRELGIPARYVAGYVVKADAFSQDENGSYTAEILDRNAHAWTEIYLDNYGWVPIEMTPGFSGEESGLPTDKAAAEAREKQELAGNGTQNDTQQAENGEEAETESSREPDSEEDSENQNPERSEVSEETEDVSEEIDQPEASESVPEQNKTADGGENAQHGAGETGGAGTAGDESDSGGNAVGSWLGRLFGAGGSGGGTGEESWFERLFDVGESDSGSEAGTGDQSRGSAGNRSDGSIRAGEEQLRGFWNTPAFLWFIRILLLAVAAVGLAAIFTALIQFVKKRIQIYHAYVDFEIRRKHYRGAVTCVNRRIYRKLRRRMHMRNRSITDQEYEQLLCTTFSQIPPEKWGRYMEIVKKAAFSGEGPEKEEAVFCREIYYDLLNGN
jgi:hypothetical protein